MLSSLNQASKKRHGKISAIKQSIDLHRRLRGRRRGALGSFTLSSNMANGRMIFQPDPYLCSSVWNPASVPK